MEKLESSLRETNYDKKETEFLIKGFSQGFHIGYQGPQDRCDTAPNLTLQVGTNEDIWEKIMKDVKQGRYAGPFDTILYNNYIQSPIGLVPKKGSDQTRLIFHLSYDF